jgi:hypothetical protein
MVAHHENSFGTVIERNPHFGRKNKQMVRCVAEVLGDSCEYLVTKRKSKIKLCAEKEKQRYF